MTESRIPSNKCEQGRWRAPEQRQPASQKRRAPARCRHWAAAPPLQRCEQCSYAAHTNRHCQYIKTQVINCASVISAHLKTAEDFGFSAYSSNDISRKVHSKYQFNSTRFLFVRALVHLQRMSNEWLSHKHSYILYIHYT